VAAALIAAPTAGTALRHQLAVVTNNVREFERIDGLQVEDWSRPAR